MGERLEASLATATWAMLAGAAMVRVHDVGPTVQAAILVGRTRLGHPETESPETEITETEKMNATGDIAGGDL
jgi:hypothetical protein